MHRDLISLDQALSLESKGAITIVDSSPESLEPIEEQGKVWRYNFQVLQKKHRNIPQAKLLNFLQARYLIQINEGLVEEDTNTFSWRYLYGLENKKVKEKSTDNIEYIYVLVNPGYPDLVKIGMTIHDVQRRATAINATATVEEWVAKMALPVKEGCAYKVEQAVHKFFASVRVSSDQGGSREFFTLDPFTAFDKIREVGAPFTVGNPIIY
jgi:hypothetical protein